jgi:hypothetical protein
LSIQNKNSEKIAIEFLTRIRQRKKQFNEIVERIRKPAHEAYKAILTFKNDLLGPLEAAESHLKRELGIYRAQTERDEARAREALLRELEQEEQERRDHEATALDKSGDHLAADMLRDSPVSISPESYETIRDLESSPGNDTETAGGISYREQWACEVVDLKELCKAIGEGIVSPTLVRPNTAELNSLARGMKKHLNVPGLKAVMAKIPVVRK